MKAMPHVVAAEQERNFVVNVLSDTVGTARIARIEWARLAGVRPRTAGANARLGEHGREVRPPIARITTTDGVTGFGWARLTPEQARHFIGRSLHEAFDEGPGVAGQFTALEYPLLDLAGKLAGKPA